MLTFYELSVFLATPATYEVVGPSAVLETRKRVIGVIDGPFAR